MKWIPIAVLAVALGLLASSQAGADLLVFDMGSADSAVWPSAQKVTPEHPGWLSTASLEAHDAPGNGDPIWTNPLTQDSITGSAESTFSFRVPPGKWNVHLICGAGGPSDRWVSQYWDFDVRVSDERWRCQIPARSWTGPYTRGEHTFSVTSDGTIEISFIPRSRWCLSGIVAWQSPAEERAREAIERIRQWTPEEERAKWTEDARPPSGPVPPVDAAERARGFYVWHRHWATPIYPWTNPTPEELRPILRAFAAPGEYEPVTFTVRPLREIQRAETQLGGVGPVPPDQVEVRKVRYVKARPNYNTQGRYRIVPDILDRWTGGPLRADENARFWLTLRVPERAAPGLYRSHITFVADGERVEIPLQLRVLDVRLEEDPEHTYGIYYYDPLARLNRAPDEASREYLRRKSELEHADMVAHGTRNVTLSCWAEAMDDAGEFRYLQESLDVLDDQLRMARRFGFQPPYVLSISSEEIYRKHMGEGLKSHLKDVEMPPGEFFAEVTALVRTIDEERERRGWPDFVYQPFDEPSSDPDSVRFMARLMQAVKAAGVRVYTTAAPEKPAYQPLKPFVDVWCTQTYLPEHDTVVADSRERGVEYWCYPNKICGENDHTPVAGARMTYGFGFWRSGFVRLIPWIYQYNSGDPFNYLDGRMMDFMVRSEPDGTPIPVVLWEAFREGYDDMRYIYSLHRAIAEAKASRSEATRQEGAEAQELLEDIWRAIPVMPEYRYQGFWVSEEMDVYRWVIAERLERLTKLLRQGPA